jgi:hypothetical protein
VAALPASFSFSVRPSRFFHPASLWGLSDSFLYLLPRAHRHREDKNADDGGQGSLPHGFPAIPATPSDPPVSSPRSRCGKRYDACFTPASEVATDASALSVVRLSVSLFLSRSLPRSHTLAFFSVPDSAVFPRDVSGKAPLASSG